MQSFLRKRINSFGYAFKGILTLLKEETNARIHLLAIVLVTSLGLFFQLHTWEWCVLVLCMGMVVAMESCNSALERLTDLVSPGQHPLAGKAKDLAAAAVLILSLMSIVVAILIFFPRINNYYFF